MEENVICPCFIRCRCPAIATKLDSPRDSSNAILWYLSEKTFLLPDDRWGRGEALQWMFFEQYSHEPYISVARFWLSFAPQDQLEKRRQLIPEWHAKGNAALGLNRVTGEPGHVPLEVAW